MSNEFGNGRIARYSSRYQLWFILKNLFLLNKGKISPMILGWTELDRTTSITLKTNIFFQMSKFLCSIVWRDFSVVKQRSILKLLIFLTAYYIIHKSHFWNNIMNQVTNLLTGIFICAQFQRKTVTIHKSLDLHEIQNSKEFF